MALTAPSCLLIIAVCNGVSLYASCRPSSVLNITLSGCNVCKFGFAWYSNKRRTRRDNPLLHAICNALSP